LLAKKYKELDIFNNEQFIILKNEFDKENIIIASDIDDEKIIDIPFDMFQKLFYVAYAITIYKSQGSTFDHEFTIHEWNHPLFDNRLKYVALSRTTKLENININMYQGERFSGHWGARGMFHIDYVTY